MSVTIKKSDGVTVFTLTSDPQSVCPPLCQIVKGLCYSPVCCSVSQHLRRVQRSSQTVLGALHIMVGLLNIGLGVILSLKYVPSWEMDGVMFAFWLGAVFVVFGTIGILSEKYPSPCLVIINVILNLSGVAFAIAGVVLYSINIVTSTAWWLCEDYDYNPSYVTTTPSPRETKMKEKCLESKEVVVILMRSMSAVLIVLSVLELCLVISSAVLGIKALRSRAKGKEKTADPEHHTPLLVENASDPTV